MFTCLCRVGNAALMYVCVCMCGHVFMLRYSHSVLFVSSLWSPGILCRFSFSVQVDYPSTSIHPSSVLSHSLFIVIFPESHPLFLRLSCSASLKWIPLLPLIDCLHWMRVLLLTQPAVYFSCSCDMMVMRCSSSGRHIVLGKAKRTAWVSAGRVRNWAALPLV